MGTKKGRVYPEYPPNKNALVLLFMVGIIARDVAVVNIRILKHSISGYFIPLTWTDRRTVPICSTINKNKVFVPNLA